MKAEVTPPDSIHDDSRKGVGRRDFGRILLGAAATAGFAGGASQADAAKAAPDMPYRVFPDLRVIRNSKIRAGEGSLLPDHVPNSHDPQDPHKLQSFAFAFGYIQGLLRAAGDEAVRATGIVSATIQATAGRRPCRPEANIPRPASRGIAPPPARR